MLENDINHHAFLLREPFGELKKCLTKSNKYSIL